MVMIVVVMMYAGLLRQFLLPYVQPLVSDVTVLLLLTVFMNLLSAIMPNTSDAVTLIGRKKTDRKEGAGVMTDRQSDKEWP
jgi:hypothetical protein